MNIRSRTRRLTSATVAAGILVISLGGAAAPPAQAASGNGPHFYSGVTVDVSDSVVGDVYAVGQNVTISGVVTGDVIAAAQTVTISGRVDGNVRLAGQDVTISGDVTRSGTIFASNLIVESHGSVENDIVATASAIHIAGDVGRDVLVSAADLRIDGTVGGDVTYSSQATAHIADGVVGGVVHHIRPQQSSLVEISPWAVLLGWFLGLLYAVVALSLVTVAAGLLLPRVLQRVTDQLMPSPWRALLVGFLAALVVPTALFFLFVTVIGAPIALTGLLVWTVLSLATFVFSAHYLGRIVLRRVTHPVLQTFIGGLVLIVGLQIPWFNILLWLAIVFFGLGAQLLAIQRQRPWNATRDAQSWDHLATAEAPAPSSSWVPPTPSTDARSQ